MSSEGLDPQGSMQNTSSPLCRHVPKWTKLDWCWCDLGRHPLRNAGPPRQPTGIQSVASPLPKVWGIDSRFRENACDLQRSCLANSISTTGLGRIPESSLNFSKLRVCGAACCPDASEGKERRLSRACRGSAPPFLRWNLQQVLPAAGKNQLRFRKCLEHLRDAGTVLFRIDKHE